MRLQILGHAGLRVNAGGRELLCDPWILGSCYWRSWWNYPPVPETIRASLSPDYIYLTHLHWDHFHGPSLRCFPKTTRFFVPYFRYDRMCRDLRNLGFHNITEIKHGRRVRLASDFAIRSYHFGPLFTDSALVIEADNTVIFNANDAKLAGLPLKQILSDYPQIDFCLRSHSSANARRCMHVEDEPTAPSDDDTHYVSSFSLFMSRVNPRFAIPFASNSCYLHKDVVGMNAFSQTPLLVKRYFESFAKSKDLATELKIMVPGDEWTSDGGFRLSEHDYFEERDVHLRQYSKRVQPILDKYYKKEDSRVSLDLIRRFFSELWQRTPYLLKRRLSNERIVIVSVSTNARDYFAVNLQSGTVSHMAADQLKSDDVRAEFPAAVLSQSIRMNMFTQAWISKRVHYYTTRSRMFILKGVLRILELNEAELLPLHRAVTFRTFKALLPRWREAFLYLHVLWHLVRRRSFLEIEARLLEVRARALE